MAKRDFLVSIDLNKNELLNAKLQNLSTLPILTTGDTGYFGWSDGTAKFWTGSYWKSLEETIPTNLNFSSDLTTINLTPITGSLSGLTTTLSGATSTKAGLLTSSLYDRLMGSVLKTDFESYSILVANSDNEPIALTATTYSLFGRMSGDMQQIPIDLTVTGVTLNNSIPSSFAIKSYIDNLIEPSGHYHYQLHQPNGSNPFVYTDNSGTLHIDGNIVQNGNAYETHAEEVFSKNDQIILRDGAIVGLGVGEYAGFTAKLYDGANDGRLVFDNTGTARVGDIGSEQPIATRIETPTNGYIAYWESANTRLNFKQLTTSDISNLNTWTGNSSINTVGIVTGGTWNGGIIGSQYGGTGINNGGRTLTINNNSGSINYISSGITLTMMGNGTLMGTNTGDVVILINSGLSLTGQTISLGTPSTIISNSLNSVVGSTHTHAISGLTTLNLASNAGISNDQLANPHITIGSTLISLGGSVSSLSGLTSISATTFIGNATTASKLENIRTITITGDTVSTAIGFDGSSNINIPTTLPNITTGGTYTKLVVNSKGQVISGTTPTTLSGYGITDAYRKFATTITGNGIGTTFIIVHNLNNEDILTSVKDFILKTKVEVEETIIDANTLQIVFNVPPINGKQYRVIIGG